MDILANPTDYIRSEVANEETAAKRRLRKSDRGLGQ